MTQQFLSLETLPAFDGGSAGVLCNQAIRAAYLDLCDRPRLAKKRTITLQIVLEPDQSEDELEGVRCTVVIKSSVPDKASRTNILAPRAEGMGFESNTRIAKFAPNQPEIPGTIERDGDE